MNQWQGELIGVEQTYALGRDIAQAAQAGDIIALIGELGAGKTQLVKGIAEGMGIDPALVSSPTFVLVHEYEPPSGMSVLVHVDAYRIESSNDLHSIGFNEEMRRGAIVAVEWADRIEGLLGDDRLEIKLEHVDDQTRHVTCTAYGNWQWRAPVSSKPPEPPAVTKCPTCSGLVPMHGDYFPFCSSRCRSADLNRWFNGDYKITRPLEQSDFEEGV